MDINNGQKFLNIIVIQKNRLDSGNIKNAQIKYCYHWNLNGTKNKIYIYIDELIRDMLISKNYENRNEKNVNVGMHRIQNVNIELSKNYINK